MLFFAAQWRSLVPFAALTPRINPRLLLPFAGSAWGTNPPPMKLLFVASPVAVSFPQTPPRATRFGGVASGAMTLEKSLISGQPCIATGLSLHSLRFSRSPPPFGGGKPRHSPPRLQRPIVDLGGGAARGAPPWRPGPVPHDSALASELESCGSLGPVRHFVAAALRGSIPTPHSKLCGSPGIGAPSCRLWRRCAPPFSGAWRPLTARVTRSVGGKPPTCCAHRKIPRLLIYFNLTDILFPIL